MFVSLRFQVDIMLRASQRFEVSLDILQVGVFGDEMANHERRVDNLFKS